jgi:amino acid transporter
MSKAKIIAILIIITLISEVGVYILKQHIEDNKRIAPEINDTPEMNRYYKMILAPFQIPLIVTILYLIYQILIVIGVIKE